MTFIIPNTFLIIAFVATTGKDSGQQTKWKKSKTKQTETTIRLKFIDFECLWQLIAKSIGFVKQPRFQTRTHEPSAHNFRCVCPRYGICVQKSVSEQWDTRTGGHKITSAEGHQSHTEHILQQSFPHGGNSISVNPLPAPCVAGWTHRIERPLTNANKSDPPRGAYNLLVRDYNVLASGFVASMVSYLLFVGGFQFDMRPV